MDSIHGINHFSSYISPQHNNFIEKTNINNKPEISSVSDGFEHTKNIDNSVMNQTDALKFLSYADKNEKTAEIKDSIHVSNVGSFDLSLNGINSKEFIYLNI